MTRIRSRHDEPVLLTGATGFLGSHVLAGLLARGRRVVIAGRPAGGESLQARIRRLLNWFGIGHLGGRLEFHETDFLKAGLGLTADAYERLRRRGLPIIHCASDTRFAEKNRETVLSSNVESLAEILAFASLSRASGFHFLSSAYAASDGRNECPEAPVSPRRFHNVYEESKALAENVVRERCREARIPYTIIRPSIVYGDARTGKSLRFNALYHPVRSLLQLRDIYLDDIRKNNGKKSIECGIRLNEEGVLRLPVRIFIPNEGKINLIPVNYFTEAVLSIFEKPENEAYYHITNRRAVSMTKLAAFTERFLNVSGIKVIIGAAVAAERKSPPEELFDFFIKAYRPYLSDERMFKRDNTDKATDGALPPEFSYEIFQRCMAYAVAVDWGKRLFA
jgi:nucleoside-diphosphate-sugar epimerase